MLVVSGREAAVDCFDLSPSVLWRAADNEVSRDSLADSYPAQAGRCTVGYVSLWRVGRGGGGVNHVNRSSVLLPLLVRAFWVIFYLYRPFGLNILPTPGDRVC